MYLNWNDVWGVLSLYCRGYGRQLYLREVSRLAGLPLANVQRAAGSLVKRRILKSHVRGRQKYFSLNLDNAQTRLALLQVEVWRTSLFLEKYPQCKTFVKGTVHIPVVVFGSFAALAADENSDLDVLTVCGKGETLPLHLIPYQVHEVRVTKTAFDKALEGQEALLKEIEENHVILSNHSFYVDMMWSRYGP